MAGSGYQEATFVSRTGRLMSVVLLVPIAVVVVDAWLYLGAVGRAVALAGAALAVALLIACCWRPRITIGESEVTVVNPFRVERIPIDRITGIGGRFTMTIATDRDVVRVWAANRRSPGANVAEIRRDPYGLPDYAAQRRFETEEGDRGQLASAAELVLRSRIERLGDPTGTRDGSASSTPGGSAGTGDRRS